MGITICCSYKHFILDYKLIIRMKLTVCLIAVCSYLALSAASVIPDKKDSENDRSIRNHSEYEDENPTTSDRFQGKWDEKDARSDGCHGHPFVGEMNKIEEDDLDCGLPRKEDYHWNIHSADEKDDIPRKKDYHWNIHSADEKDDIPRKKDYHWNIHSADEKDDRRW